MWAHFSFFLAVHAGSCLCGIKAGSFLQSETIAIAGPCALSLGLLLANLPVCALKAGGHSTGSTSGSCPCTTVPSSAVPPSHHGWKQSARRRSRDQTGPSTTHPSHPAAADEDGTDSLLLVTGLLHAFSTLTAHTPNRHQPPCTTAREQHGGYPQQQPRCCQIARSSWSHRRDALPGMDGVAGAGVPAPAASVARRGGSPQPWGRPHRLRALHLQRLLLPQVLQRTRQPRDWWVAGGRGAGRRTQGPLGAYTHHMPVGA